jgi:NTE family protein
VKKIPVYCLISLMIIAVMASSLYAQGGVVLALSGGGTRGLAHIGVMEVLEEKGIPVAGVVGTSIGAIIGGLYCSGYKASQLREILLETDLTSLLNNRSERIFAATGREQVTAKGLPWISLNEKKQIVGPLGTDPGVALLERFVQLASEVNVVNFNNLCIPFAAIATDLENGKKVVLRRGSLASAMRASMAVPALFEPWPIEGRLLVDGGLVSNMPVSTARELFPGYPLIAVNVTTPLRPRDQLRSIIDVVDQSVTIMTMQNIDREIAAADLVIRPELDENIPLLGTSMISEIINSGRTAIEDDIPLIRDLVHQAPPIECAIGSFSETVQDVVFRGVPEEISGELRSRYSHWIGHPVDTAQILEACEKIRTRDDVSSVEYYLDEPEEKLSVVIVVQRKPAYEIKLGGYATNLHDNRWLRLNALERDYLKYGDKLSLDLRMGDQWGFDLDYFSTPNRYGGWNFSLGAQRWDLDPANSFSVDWEEYGLSAYRVSRAGGFDIGYGMAFRLNSFDDYDNDFWGPVVYASFETSAEHEGSSNSLTGCAWWPDLEEPLFRIQFTNEVEGSGKWSSLFRAGFAEGDISHPATAVYLGSREELYSYADNPLRAERMTWANLILRRELVSSWWGKLTADLITGYGYTWDDGWDGLGEAWEAGIGLSIPGYFLDAQLLMLWNEDDDFTLGFTIGHPYWGSCPIGR